jgi:hypothetical protein
MTKMAMLSNPIARSVRRVAVGTVSRIGPMRHVITMWITGLKRSPLRHGLAGSRTTSAESTNTELNRRGIDARRETSSPTSAVERVGEACPRLPDVSPGQARVAAVGRLPSAAGVERSG